MASLDTFRYPPDRACSSWYNWLKTFKTCNRIFAVYILLKTDPFNCTYNSVLYSLIQENRCAGLFRTMFFVTSRLHYRKWNIFHWQLKRKMRITRYIFVQFVIWNGQNVYWIGMNDREARISYRRYWISLIKSFLMMKFTKHDTILAVSWKLNHGMEE